MAVWRCVLISFIVVALSTGCRREAIRSLTAPELDVTAPSVEQEPAAAPSPSAVETDGTRIRARIADLTVGADARRIESVTRIDGGALVLLRQDEPSAVGWSSFVLRDGHEGPAWAIDGARETTTPLAPSASRVAALDGGPLMIVSPTENLGRIGQSGALAVRLVRADGRIDDASRWLPLDPDVVFDGAWGVGAAHDVAVVCFAGRGPDTADRSHALGPVRDLFCGALDREGLWSREPTRVLAAGTEPEDPSTVRAIWVGSGTDGAVLVAVFLAGGGQDRVVGLLLDVERWDVSQPLDLGAPRLRQPGTFAWRRAPMLLTTAQGTAYAFPGTGESNAFAGWLGADGQRRGALLTISELGTAAERTVMTVVGGTPVLIYDLPGVSASRSVVAYDGETPFVADLERVSPRIERNGPAAAGLLSLVVEGSGGSELWVVDAATFGGAREEGVPLRASDRVRLPEPRFEDAGRNEPGDAGGWSDAGR